MGILIEESDVHFVPFPFRMVVSFHFHVLEFHSMECCCKQLCNVKVLSLVHAPNFHL